MTATASPPAPGVIPQPVTTPLTDLPTDPFLVDQIEAVFEDIRVGVQFSPRGHVYSYLAPPIAHVGSIVIVPANAICPTPQTVDVVTLDPPPYPGPIKRVLAVLT